VTHPATPRPAPDRLVVAIDGPSGAGKSTVAALLAARLGAARLDTGAMYRAVTLAALRRGVPLDDEPALAALARRLVLDVGDDRVLLDGEDVAAAIRSPEVDRAVSHVAAHPAVRAVLVAAQQRWIQDHPRAVVEGRDIGTVVAPGADLKVYLTAPPAERGRRRAAQRAGQAADPAAETAALEARDRLDAGRAASPLPRPEDLAADAVLLDTAGQSPDAIVDELLARLGPRRATPSAPQSPVASQPLPGIGARAARRLADWRARSDPRGPWPPEIGLGPRSYRAVRRLVRAINRTAWRVTVHHPERLPTSGPYIIAPAHRSFVDFFVVAELTPRTLHYMAKAELWRSRLLGALIGVLGGFPVDREGVDRQAMSRAETVLARGDVLVVFPEGRRIEGPQLARLEEGVAFLAARSQVPVVPVGVGGTHRVLPKGRWLPRLVPVHLVVGEPLAPPPRSERGRVARHQVHALNEALASALQACLDEARRLAGDDPPTSAS
jgi:cytidylate kinase